MKTITPHQTESARQNPEVTLLDVRTPLEFTEKHIEGSQHVPLDQLKDKIAALRKDQSFILVCAAGQRAEKACQLLDAKNFANLQVLEDGIQGWDRAGLPLTRSTRKCLPLMRQVQLVIGLGVLIFSLLAYFVNPAFAFGAAFFGAGLTMAGTTGWCGLANLLAKMPWNRRKEGTQSCAA